MSGSDALQDGRETPTSASPQLPARRETSASTVGPQLDVPDDAVSGSPQPPASSGQEDLLGLRIAAALIDLVLLAGLFVIMAVTVGESSTAGGFYVSLHGWWFIAFLALALLYYFALEAATGRTVGKRVLGLRVSGAGERASVGAVAGRTLLRVVDWLPVLYLVGFVTMLVTGARRQRVGDLAAGTSVVRTPVRHRGLAFVSLAVVVLAAIGLSVYRANSPEGPHTYRAHGISFDYPAAWHVRDFETITGTGGGAPELWRTAVGPGKKFDLITVEAYRMSDSVTTQNIDAVIPQLESMTRQLFDQEGGALEAGPEKITVAGQPAVRFRGTGTMEGSRVQSTHVFAFSGVTEYIVSCQYTAARATEVLRACDQVVSSFQVPGGTNTTGPTPAPTPTTAVTETAAPPASEPSTPPANTPQTIKIGQTATVTMDGTDAANLTIVSVNTSTRPADEVGSPPQHGYFLTVQVRVKALPSYRNGFVITPFDFYAVVGSSHFEEGNGNALDAPGADRELDVATLNAGESISGTLVFDVPAKHGNIVYSPVDQGGPIADWTF